MQLNRAGVTAVAIYLIAIILLLAVRYFDDGAAAVEFGQIILVGLPLTFMWLGLLLEMSFMEKYALFFFPLCLGFVYWLGCAIGRIWQSRKVSGVSESNRPPETL